MKEETKRNNPGKYAGIRCSSDVPETCVFKKLAYTRRVHGREVKYWEVWVKDLDDFQPPFDDKTLNKSKVRRVNNIIRNFIKYQEDNE